MNFTNVLRLVFSSRLNALVATASGVSLWVVLNVLDGLILLTPFVQFYLPIPDDAIPGFMLSFATAAMAGLAGGMNLFLARAGVGGGRAAFVSGSTLGTISSVCVSCSSIGFYAASAFGMAGVATSSFLSAYQLPLRAAAVAVLAIACLSAGRRVGRTCKLAT